MVYCYSYKRFVLTGNVKSTTYNVQNNTFIRVLLVN